MPTHTSCGASCRHFLRGNRSINDMLAACLLECWEHGIFDEDCQKITEPVSKYGQRPVCHIAIDDAQSSKLMAGSASSSPYSLCQVAIKHRHIAPMKRLGEALSVSLWLMLQSYSCQGGLNKMIRGQCTHLLLFKIQDKKW